MHEQLVEVGASLRVRRIAHDGHLTTVDVKQLADLKPQDKVDHRVIRTDNKVMMTVYSLCHLTQKGNIASIGHNHKQ